MLLAIDPLTTVLIVLVVMLFGLTLIIQWTKRQDDKSFSKLYTVLTDKNRDIRKGKMQILHALEKIGKNPPMISALNGENIETSALNLIMHGQQIPSKIIHFNPSGYASLAQVTSLIDKLADAPAEPIMEWESEHKTTSLIKIWKNNQYVFVLIKAIKYASKEHVLASFGEELYLSSCLPNDPKSCMIVPEIFIFGFTNTGIKEKHLKRHIKWFEYLTDENELPLFSVSAYTVVKSISINHRGEVELKKLWDYKPEVPLDIGLDYNYQSSTVLVEGKETQVNLGKAINNILDFYVENDKGNLHMLFSGAPGSGKSHLLAYIRTILFNKEVKRDTAIIMCAPALFKSFITDLSVLRGLSDRRVIVFTEENDELLREGSNDELVGQFKDVVAGSQSSQYDISFFMSTNLKYEEVNKAFTRNHRFDLRIHLRPLEKDQAMHILNTKAQEGMVVDQEFIKEHFKKNQSIVLGSIYNLALATQGNPETLEAMGRVRSFKKALLTGENLDYSKIIPEEKNDSKGTLTSSIKSEDSTDESLQADPPSGDPDPFNNPFSGL